MKNKLKLLSFIPLYKLNRAIGWPKLLPLNLTLSISTDCNSRCQTCQIWQKKENDLTIKEWDKILASIGKSPFWITISGGEPFLQKHLTELVKKCHHYCQPAIINIPTNGLLTAIITNEVEKMCRDLDCIQLIINLSIDGVAEKHDQLRGVKGNFEKVLSTLNNLKKLQQKYTNLTIGIHSVISNYNYQDVDQLFDWALSMKPNQYITEIAEQRIELATKNQPLTPTYENYSLAINKLIERIKKQNFKGVAKITEAFRLEYYNNVKKYLKSGKQVIPCYAGIASAQIYCQGEVWECCIEANSFGNLRENGYNFPKIWYSKKAKAIRKKVKNGDCGCPLANASYTNMLFNCRSLFNVLKNYFTL